MSKIIESISYININNENHPIDALSIGGKTISEIGELVTFIDEGSTDSQYPSAKCIYEMVYGSVPVHDYSKDYLTLDIVDGGTLQWKRTNSQVPEKTIQYRINGGSWNTVTSSLSNDTVFNVNSGDKVEVKGQNTSYNNSSNARGNSFIGSATFNVSGNIMSIIDGDDFENLTTLTSAYTFSFLFGNSKVIDASKLVLPATTLASYCYSYMFMNVQA